MMETRSNKSGSRMSKKSRHSKKSYRTISKTSQDDRSLYKFQKPTERKKKGKMNRRERD